MGQSIENVVVVGAGPVGLLTALMLAKVGISVQVYEKKTEIDQRPRGAAYGRAAVRVLRQAQVLDKVREIGIDVSSIAWRKLDGTRITGFSQRHDQSDPERSLVLPVHLLAKFLYDEVKSLPKVEVFWGHEFKKLTQREDKVTVELETDGGTISAEADFVLGCDGAQSEVRKCLFGRNFPGMSWDVQIVATNVKYSGFEIPGWSDVQWIIHPEHWALICRLDREGTWRVAYGEKADLDTKTLRERLPAKFKAILPGHPEPGDYELLNWSPFVMHQRCAERMSVGRVLLAGDAAHLCNPMGGLGLTGGIADVGSLVECLVAIHNGAADFSILEKYDEKRREVYRTVTDPTSSENLKRVFNDGETVLEHDRLLQMIEKSATDPALGKILMQFENALSSDMTQFYTSSAK